MPQNRVGFLVITCGPGMMPWMVMAPTISAITAFGGMPSVSSGMNEVCAPALLALRPGHALDGAAAEAARILGKLLRPYRRRTARAPRHCRAGCRGSTRSVPRMTGL